MRRRRMMWVSLGTGCLLAAACGDDGASGTGEAGCPECAAPEIVGALADPEMRETSGLVASAAHVGTWYLHNDAGDDARLFAIAESGALQATLALDVPHVDWEDVALGPCAAGRCLYVGDIGDNDLSRDAYVVYRVVEPVQLKDSVLPAEALPFAYPDGPHDAETLLVDPASGVITVVTKVEAGASAIYELPPPLQPGVRVELVRAGSVTPPKGSPRITGGDVRPDGTGVLLRTRSGVFFYPKEAEQSVAAALAGEGCAGPDLAEEQGEAIGWTRDGTGWLSVGEGLSAAVHLTRCEP